MKKFFLLFLLLFWGCGLTPDQIMTPIGSAAVNSYIVWREGEAHKCYEYSPKIVHNATLAALKEMKIPIKSDKGSDKYQIIAGDKNRFKIKIESIQDNVTKLNIRINYFGDRAYAEIVYKLVDENLYTIRFQKKKSPDKAPEKRKTRRFGTLK